jgi:hypothetical protein
MKKCPSCGLEGKFHKNKSRKDGLQNECQKCRKEQGQKWRLENKEYSKQRNKEYNQTLKGRWKSHKSGAKCRNLDNQLTFEQFDEITKQKCWYCSKYSKDKDFCGIDRTNANIGYVFKNCKPCCEKHNYMKQNLSEQEFYEACLEVVQNGNKQPC